MLTGMPADWLDHGHGEPAEHLDVVFDGAGRLPAAKPPVRIAYLLTGKRSGQASHLRRTMTAVVSWTVAFAIAGAGTWAVRETLFPDGGRATAESVWQNPGRSPAATSTPTETTTATPSTTTTTSTSTTSTTLLPRVVPPTTAHDNRGRGSVTSGSSSTRGPVPSATTVEAEHGRGGPIQGPTTTDDHRGRDGGARLSTTTVDDHGGRDSGGDDALSGHGGSGSGGSGGSGSSDGSSHGG